LISEIRVGKGGGGISLKKETYWGRGENPGGKTTENNLSKWAGEKAWVRGGVPLERRGWATLLKLRKKGEGAVHFI